jgi:hypothetical protein
VIPDVDGYDGRLVILVHDYRQAVLQDEFLVGDVDVDFLGGNETAKNEKQSGGDTNAHGILPN